MSHYWVYAGAGGAAFLPARHPNRIYDWNPTLHQARQDFIEAFKEYAQEGNLMRDILLSHDSLTPHPDFTEVITAQQERLNERRCRYEQAREAYVSMILPELVMPSVTRWRQSPYYQSH